MSSLSTDSPDSEQPLNPPRSSHTSSSDAPPTLPIQTESTAISQAAVFCNDVVKPFSKMLVYFFVVFLYTLILGCFFLAIEGPTARVEADAAIAQLRAQNFTKEQEEYLQKEFGIAVPYDEDPTQWNVMSSQYFVTVMLTTIGYGDMVPVTVPGRWLAFVVGVFFIPLTGHLLLAAGKHFVQAAFGMQLLTYGLCRQVRFKRGKYPLCVERMMNDLEGLQRPLNLHDLYGLMTELKGSSVGWLEVCLVMESADADRSGDLDKEEVRWALLDWAQKLTVDEQQSNPTALLYVTCMLVGWLTFGAICFVFLEGLTLSQAWWFCFVTLATIGYGDITPTSYGSRVFWLIFIYVGFGIMAWSLQSISHYVGQGAGHAVSGHLQFSMHYDWDASSDKPLCSNLKVLGPTIASIFYAVLGGFLLLELDDSALQGIPLKVTEIINSHAFTPEQQVYLRGQLDHPVELWDFWDSTRLAVSSIATVGYGDMVPFTAGGRLALLCYASIGIGLIAFFVSRQAELAYSLITKAYIAICKLFGSKHRLWDEELFEQHVEALLNKIDSMHLATINEACDIIDDCITNSKFDIVTLRKLMKGAEVEGGLLDSNRLLVILAQWLQEQMRSMALTKFLLNCMMFGFCSLAFAGVFVTTDKWSYGDSLWFTFVTTTTIGFGDFVPESQASSSILNIALILTNLGFLANCVTAAGPVLRSALKHGRLFLVRRRKGGIPWVQSKVALARLFD